MSKQDRQGARTPADLEIKYRFGKVFQSQARENASQNSRMNQQDLTLSQFISYAASALDGLRSDVDAAREEREGLQGAITALETRITDAETNAQTQADALAALETRLQTLETRQRDAEGLISGLAESLAALEERIEALEQKEEEA